MFNSIVYVVIDKTYFSSLVNEITFPNNEIKYDHWLLIYLLKYSQST